MRAVVCSFVLVTCLVAAPARTLANDTFPSDLHGWVDFRAAYTTAGREWLDGGFSKTRYGSIDGRGGDAEIAEASLEWTPSFGAAWSGHFHLQATPDQGAAVGPVEAFVSYRTLPKLGWRLSARAGRYFPLVSMEHNGPGWGLTRTITPSALNSWIGEEAAVTGVEMRAARAFGDHHVDVRIGGFGFNDTAGALLAYRGWALHDVKTIIGGGFRIPDRDDRRMLLPDQAERTRPFQELDGRIGVNAAIKWRHSDFLTVLLSAYDNRADPLALEEGQYGWATRFVSLGLHYNPTETIEIITQGMYGDTAMGPFTTETDRRLFNVEYYSAFFLVSHRVSQKHIVSARFDYFATDDRGAALLAQGENGWATTFSSLYEVNRHLNVGVEALYIENNSGNDPTTTDRARDLQLQFMMRVGF